MKVHIFFTVSTLAVLISSGNCQYGGAYGQPQYDFQGYGQSADYGYGNSIPNSLFPSKFNKLKTLSKLGLGCESALAGKTAAIKSKCSELLKRQSYKTNLALQELNAQQFSGYDQFYNQGQIYNAQPGGISQAQLQGLSPQSLQAAGQIYGAQPSPISQAQLQGLPPQSLQAANIQSALQSLQQLALPGTPNQASPGLQGLQGSAAFPGSQNPAAYPGSQSPAAYPGSQSPAAYPGSQSPAAYPGSPSPAFPSFPGSPLSGVPNPAYGSIMQEIPDSAFRGLRGANLQEIPSPGYPSFQEIPSGPFQGPQAGPPFSGLQAVPSSPYPDLPQGLSPYQSFSQGPASSPGTPPGPAYPGSLAGPTFPGSSAGPGPAFPCLQAVPSAFQDLPAGLSAFQNLPQGPASFAGPPTGSGFQGQLSGPAFPGFPEPTYQPMPNSPYEPPQNFQSAPCPPPQSSPYSPPQSPSCEAQNFQIPFDLLCKMSSEPLGRDAKIPHRIINMSGPNQTPDDASPQWGPQPQPQPQYSSDFQAQPSQQGDQCMANYPFDKYMQMVPQDQPQYSPSQYDQGQSQGPIPFPPGPGDNQDQPQQQWG